jgi:uncharacterized protein (TIGR02466 family)
VFESSRALQLFPTVVFQYTLQHGVTLNRKFEREIARLRVETPLWKGKPTPWQCSPTLHRNPVFQPLVDAVGEAVRASGKGLHHEVDGFQITGMWANWLRATEFHPPHHHSNNFWSGVYWVRSDHPDASPLTFSHPNPAARVLVPRLGELTMANAASWSLPSVPGVLTLFPSWLSHYVGALPDGERISVAFNVMLRGQLSTPDSLQWVDLG